MKQCPRLCEVCREPIQELGAVVAVMGAPDATQLWTCHRQSCQRDAVLQQDRGHPKPRGEIVIHVQRIERHDVKLIAAKPHIVVTGGGP